MATQADKLVTEIRALPDEEKLRVLDAILTDLDKFGAGDSHRGGSTVAIVRGEGWRVVT